MSDINVNNDYTKMNNLTAFKLCVIQNFPFIEADFDAVTNYQLLCKVVEYLNNIIDNNNKQNTNITQLEQNFITLYNYVKDYFDNLDVQEEINNKIDELITSGSFAVLFKSFIGYVMPEWYGAVGDGVHDDTTAFNNAISTGMSVLLGVNKHYILKNNITLNKLWGNNSTVEFLIDITDMPVRELAQAISVKKEIRDITIISPNGFISVYSADNVNIENVICFCIASDIIIYIKYNVYFVSFGVSIATDESVTHSISSVLRPIRPVVAPSFTIRMSPLYALQPADTRF